MDRPNMCHSFVPWSISALSECSVQKVTLQVIRITLHHKGWGELGCSLLAERGEVLPVPVRAPPFPSLSRKGPLFLTRHQLDVFWTSWTAACFMVGCRRGNKAWYLTVRRSVMMTGCTSMKQNKALAWCSPRMQPLGKVLPVERRNYNAIAFCTSLSLCAKPQISGQLSLRKDGHIHSHG